MNKQVCNAAQAGRDAFAECVTNLCAQKRELQKLNIATILQRTGKFRLPLGEDVVDHLQVCVSAMDERDRMNSQNVAESGRLGRVQLLAKRGYIGQMQISVELVPIPDASGCVRMRRGFQFSKETIIAF